MKWNEMEPTISICIYTNSKGQSDLLRIEIARVQKEEIELKKQRRLLEMEEQGKKKKWGEWMNEDWKIKI